MSRPRKFYYNTCETCGVVFEARKADTRTCSADCRRRLQIKETLEKHGRIISPARLESRECVICGAVYEPATGSQLTCSAACGRALNAKRCAERRKKAAQPETVQMLPLHVAEGVCRRLGMSYGEASAEAFNCEMSLSRYLVCRATREGIEIFKEGEQ